MPDRDPDTEPIDNPDDWEAVLDSDTNRTALLDGYEHDLLDAEHTAALAVALYAAGRDLDLDHQHARRLALRGTRIAHQYRFEQRRWERIAAAEQLPPWEPERAGSDAHRDLRAPAGRAADGDDPPGRDAPVQPAGGEPGAGAPDLPGGGAVPVADAHPDPNPDRFTHHPTFFHPDEPAGYRNSGYAHAHRAIRTDAVLRHTGGHPGHDHPGHARDERDTYNTGYTYPGDPA